MESNNNNNKLIRVLKNKVELIVIHGFRGIQLWKILHNFEIEKKLWKNIFE